MTDTDTILQRIEDGEHFMQPYQEKTRRNVLRYLALDRILGSDDNQSAQQEAAPQRRDLPLGEINFPAINIRQKVAQLSMLNPDWLIEHEDPEQGTLVKDFLHDHMQKQNLVRLGKRNLLFYGLSGMSFTAYLWTPKGFTMEFVYPRDLAFDPFTTNEMWEDPRWGGRRVRLPIAEAIKRYGRAKLHIYSSIEENDLEERYEDGIPIWTYWDAQTECEIFDTGLETEENRPLKIGPNRYGRVPIAVLLGNHDPDSEFCLGDYDQVLGAWEMQRMLQRALQRTALAGGGKMWMRREYIDDDQAEEALYGEIEGPILVNSAPGEEALGWTRAEPLNPAVVEALRYTGDGVDADQAITGMDRGVQTSHPRFATEATLMASRSTARGSQARLDLENFFNFLGRECVRLTAKFGLDPRGGQPSPRDVATYQALRGVSGVRVIEESSSFRDPEAEKQSTMQLAELASRLFPMTIQTGEPLDIWAFIDDALKAHGRRHLDRYRMDDQHKKQFFDALQQQAQAQQQGTQGSGRAAPRSPAESLNYKDAPPDIRRQIEAQAGLQPSTMDNLSQPQIELAKAGAQGTLQREQQLGEQAHEARMRAHDQEHEQAMAAQQAQAQAGMESMRQAHEADSQAAQMGHEQGQEAMRQQATAQIEQLRQRSAALRQSRQGPAERGR